VLQEFVWVLNPIICNAMLLVEYHLTGPFSCKDYFVVVLNQLYAYLVHHLLKQIQKFCARFVKESYDGSS
jgi:hypothetical protein